MIVQIISGFRGVGKTTFINRYLKQIPGKVFVILNDFGSETVSSEDFGERVKEDEINGGCICCGMALEFQEKMKQIIFGEKPDWILVEASGFGKLSDVLKVCQQEREDEQMCFSIGKSVTVVDVPTISMYFDGLGEFYQDQIQYANAILLNYIDMEDAEQNEIENGLELLGEQNPDAFTTENPDLLIEYLL